MECFYCGKTAWTTGLEKHHLWRGNNRKTSPTIKLCNLCHSKATRNYKFAELLQKLWTVRQKDNL